MGLLSDPNYGSAKWIAVILKLYFPLCVACYAAAIGWFVMLGSKEFNNETYFSENALLPGLVTNEFNAAQSSNQFYNEFLQELEDKYSDTDEMPVPWLVAKMSQLHLEVYTHNFTLNSPLGQGQVFYGTNVYGILRAPRTSSLEALVVSAPYRSIRSHLKGTAAGIALMLSFAQFARPQKYWAKDIIFLITCHEQLGMQAWLEAYHAPRRAGTFHSSLGAFGGAGAGGAGGGAGGGGGGGGALRAGRLPGRSGAIQAAINLEFHTPKIKYVEVKIEGLNGQLPNLDLPNLVHKLCAKTGLYHSYRNSYSWLRRGPAAGRDQLRTLLGMVVTQLPGVPSGNHGLFHRFGIEAVTLEGREADDPAGPAPRAQTLQASNFYRLGVALESILRSLNNLLERFHQSYFFYLMVSLNRFASIGQYMPSLCLLIAVMLIKSLALWVEIQKKPEDEKEDKDQKCNKSDEKQKEKLSTDSVKESPNSENQSKDSVKESTESVKGSKDSVKESKDSVKKSKESLKESKDSVKESAEKKPKKKVTFAEENAEKSSMSIVNIGINFLLVHSLGYAVMHSPVLFSQFGASYGYKSETSLFYGLAASSLLLALFTPLALRYLRTGPLNYPELALLNVLVLLELATVCLCVGMHNISLGLCLGVVYAPLALVAGVTEGEGRGSKYKRLLACASCILLHPLTLITLCSALYAGVSLPEEGLLLLPLLGRGQAAAAQLIMYTYVDSVVFGNWLFHLVTTLVLPTWIFFWQLVCTKVTKEV